MSSTCVSRDFFLYLAKVKTNIQKQGDGSVDGQTFIPLIYGRYIIWLPSTLKNLILRMDHWCTWIERPLSCHTHLCIWKVFQVWSADWDTAPLHLMSTGWLYCVGRHFHLLCPQWTEKDQQNTMTERESTICSFLRLHKNQNVTWLGREKLGQWKLPY